MQGCNHCSFVDARNQALIDRRSSRDPQGMAIEAPFAKKVARFQNTYDASLPRSETTVSLILPF
jgi:hypothetical protein